MDAGLLTQIGLAVLTLITTGIGILLSILYNKGEKTEDALNEHKQVVARDYLQRTELGAIIMAFDKRMDKMETWIGRRIDVLMDRKQSQTRDDEP